MKILLSRLLLSIALGSSCTLTCEAAAGTGDEIFGPPNMLKTEPTPFGPAISSTRTDNAGAESTLTLPTRGASRLSGLGHRLITNTLVYLPGRMVLGKPAEFVIKGRPGSKVAISMAEKNSGSKPVYGQNLRLGADRKLVAIGKIPETGVLSLYIDTPIQGDLIGEHLFFETAVWSKPDFSDLEIANPVKSEITDQEKEFANGIIISPEFEQKRGIRIKPEPAVPFYQRQGNTQTSLDSGRP
ncbi:MAG: hypothetical protein K2W82_09335 [Candidatus Obscuribacterales bacterium]|jgi:hypothetical protein|nr:hypothetical protein [Candidatus Obscuribacterales bacterium]